MNSDLSSLRKSDHCQLYLWLSQVELKLNNFPAALKANEKDLDFAEGNQNYVIEAKLQRARILSAADRTDEALGVLTALEQETTDLPEYESIRVFIASQVFFKTKNYKLAFGALARYQGMISQFNREQAASQLAFIKAMMEDADRDLQLAKQKQLASTAVAEREKSASEIQLAIAKHRTTERNLLALALFTIIALGFVASRFWVARKLQIQSKQLNADLNQSLNQRTRQLMAETEDRRKLELAVERQRRDQVLGQLTGGVAHDFNNLLTIIMQSNELAQQFDSRLSDAAIEQLQTSTQAASTGARIISQLLKFARQSPIKPMLLDLSQWKSGTGEMFQRIVGENRLDFSIDGNEPALLTVEVDDAQLTTAVINLLSNSRDAMEAPGVVGLRVHREIVEHPQGCVGGEIPRGDFIVIEISDEGTGMTREQLEQACEPYYSTKLHGAGTGLGLSSVLGFVKQSKGQLQISSAAGCGTTVRIFLPRVEVPITLPCEGISIPSSQSVQTV